MNIQDKINKLKTDHRLNISYSSIGECGIVAAIYFQLAVGSEVLDETEEDFKTCAPIQTATGLEDCKTFLLEDYIPSFLRQVRIQERDSGEDFTSLYQTAFFNTTKDKVGDLIEALVGGAFSEYIDINENVAKTKMAMILAVNVISRGVDNPYDFFDTETETFDSNFTYGVRFFVGINFTEQRPDGTVATLYLNDNNIQELINKHKANQTL